MNKYERHNFNKARKLINWSFIGILSPIVGILLAAIGKSVLKDIPEQDDESHEERIAKLLGRGSVAIFIYCLVFMANVAFGIFVLYNMYNNQTRVQDISWQAGYDKGHDAGLAEVGPRISDDETKLGNIRSSYNDLVGQLKMEFPRESTNLSCLSGSYDGVLDFTTIQCQ